MKSQNPYQKFDAKHVELQTLLQENPRFKRMYDEYDHLSENLWNLEQSEGESITDEFLNYIKVQTNYLEAELEDFILADSSLHSK